MATISIDIETREALKELGKMGDTYNDVITNLITMYKYKDHGISDTSTSAQDKAFIEEIIRAE